ncbi:MAG TPA: DUF1127 domain-containing protein [Candidatus Cybelea sp.]|nr:DUF1127 domain-containing protein [Candidatus Cybelea sp.]
MSDATYELLTNIEGWSLIQPVAERIGKWRRTARERAQLARLTDRELQDIGRTRAEIEYELTRPYWWS